MQHREAHSEDLLVTIMIAATLAVTPVRGWTALQAGWWGGPEVSLHYVHIYVFSLMASIYCLKLSKYGAFTKYEELSYQTIAFLHAVPVSTNFCQSY